MRTSHSNAGAALLIAWAAGSAAHGQLTTIERNSTVPIKGADIDVFRRDVTHFTYDLRILPDRGWGATEIELDVVGIGRIWHASDEVQIPPTDNLTVPFVYDLGTNTLEFDTFLTTPGLRWFELAALASPCGLVSTETRIRGLNASCSEIPLAWFDHPPEDHHFIGARFTFEVAPNFADLSLDPAGRRLFATIRGTTSEGPFSEDFAFEMYQTTDCNGNGIPDVQDIADGTSEDCNDNLLPDECIAYEDDCNANGRPDQCDIDDGQSPDCNANGVPDECIEYEDDCNANGRPDACDVSDGDARDCNANGVPDECDVDTGDSADRNGNGVPDECEIVFVTRNDYLPTEGVDLPGFHRNGTHFTFDLRFDTTVFGADWLAAEAAVEVVGDGRIWHATDERDLGNLIGNLNTPNIDGESTDTLAFDTFLSIPGHDFFLTPNVLAPGGVVSDDTRIHGLTSQGVPIPLVWYDTASHADGFRFIGLRITFESTVPGVDLTLDPVGELFATIEGRFIHLENIEGIPFAFEVYAVVCPGDVDSDHVVGLSDLAALLANFGREAGATRVDGDLNADWRVDLQDLSLLLSHYGESCD